MKICLSKETLLEGERADRDRDSSVWVFRQASWAEGHINEWAEYSLRKEGFGGIDLPDFSSQLHFPEGRKNFGPCLA